MRMMLAALTAAALAAMAGPAQAEITYPWCSQVASQDGARNCGFSTYAQCRAAASGNGAYCVENPMYRATTGTTPEPRKHRR